ncbi:MAG: ankyrin repeat domain-containing protein, partial [Beijerinckiaceae bacterium]
ANTVEWTNGAPKAVKAQGDGEPVAYGDANPLVTECRHFLDVIAGVCPPRTDGAEGLRVLRVLEKASVAIGKQVSSIALNPRALPDGEWEKFVFCKSMSVADLLSRGWSVDARDKFGRTLLMASCRGGNIESAKLLLAAGADVNAMNVNGTTPLMYAKSTAISSGNLQLVELLLAHGANAGARDKLGLSAIDYVEKNSQALISLLRRGGE